MRGELTDAWNWTDSPAAVPKPDLSKLPVVPPLADDSSPPPLVSEKQVQADVSAEASALVESVAHEARSEDIEQSWTDVTAGEGELSSIPQQKKRKGRKKN